MGMAEQLASILYPDTASTNPWVYGGKALMQTRTPQFEEPWMTGLAQALTGLAGGAITGLGMRQARADQMAQTRAAVNYLGDVDPKVKEMLTSDNEVANKLGMAMLGQEFDSKAAAKASELEWEKFKRQEGFKQKGQEDLKKLEIGATAQKEATERAVKDAEAKQKSLESILTFNERLAKEEPGKNWYQSQKDYRTLIDTLEKNSAIADLSGIKLLERIANPGSVVSPGEYQTAQDALPALSRLLPTLKSYFTGDSRLTPEARSAILDAAKASLTNTGVAYNQRLDQVKGISGDLGWDEAKYAPYPRFSEDFFKPKPLTQEGLEGVINEAASANGLEPAVFKALIKAESGFKPDAVSPKGALGYTQLLPGTAKDLGVDPTDPKQNIQGGAKFLGQQMQASGGDLVKALASYNAGPENVKKYGGLPPFPETQAYVLRILKESGKQIPHGYAVVEDDSGRQYLMTVEQARRVAGGS